LVDSLQRILKVTPDYTKGKTARQENAVSGFQQRTPLFLAEGQTHQAE